MGGVKGVALFFKGSQTETVNSNTHSHLASFPCGVRKSSCI